MSAPTYTLRMADKPVTPSLEYFRSRKAAERGKRYWQRVTGLKLVVRFSK